MSIHGKCARCGFVFPLVFGTNCPNCTMYNRVEHVRKAFAPLDPLRTALGINSFEDDWEYYHPSLWKSTEQAEEDPKGCRVPFGEQAQVYELRRLFRL